MDEGHRPEWKDLTRECVRQYIKHALRLRHKVERRKQELEELRAAASGLTGIDYTRDMVSQSSSGDAIPNAVIRLQDMIEEGMADLAEYVNALERLKADFDAMHDQLNARIVRMHYVDGMEYSDILKELKGEGEAWSEASIKRFCADGLDELYHIIPHEWTIPAHPAI